MPRRSLLALLCCSLLCGPAHGATLKAIKLLVQSTTLPHSPVVVPVADLQKQFPDFDPASFVVLTSDAATLDADAKATHFRDLPAQADDLTGGGKPTEIAFETDWPARERRVVTLEYGPEAAVAPLRPVVTLQAHALFARKYEGMGWESDRVAWRLYYDKRNAIDLYGKRRPGLSLDYFAQPGVNYEKDSPFGRDIFWNGPVALGIGSTCAWVDGQPVRVSDVTARHWKVLADGPVRAVAEITYTGWKVGGRSVDLTSRLTIWAGQHWFLNELSATNAEGLTFVTGLPTKPNVTVLTSPSAGRQHRSLADWGSQVQRSGEESARVNGDNLGLAVILSHGPAEAGPFNDPADNLMAISMRTRDGVTTGRYAVVAGWDQEAPDGQLPAAARSADSWRRYIETLNPDIFTPATVEIAPPSAAQAAAAPVVSAPADPHPLSRPSIQAAMRRACDYQLTLQTGTRQNGWVRATFYAGVMALYDSTHDRKYLDAARRWADDFGWAPNPRNPVNADNQCCIQTYAELAALDKDKSHLAPALAAYAQQMAAPKPGRVQWWWCDSLFMAPPGMARVSQVTGDPKYAAFMNGLWWDTADFLYDKDEHLFFRDKGYFNAKAPNGKKVFWSRGNGWVMAGTVRVLDALPANDPNRPRFVALHQAMAARIAGLQGADGLWRPSLLDPDQFPSPETSGTGFFTYALAWGINHGTLDRKTYLPVVQKAWLGLVSKMGPDGRLGYVQGPAGAPGRVLPDHTEEYAVGAFLLAGSEMAKLAER